MSRQPLPVGRLPREWQPFFWELHAVVVSNMRSPLVRSWSTPREAMAWIRANLPYTYNPALPVVDVDSAIMRPWPSGRGVGFAACGEAAAAIAAVGKRRRSHVLYSLEFVDGVPNYAHVVAQVDGVPFDVYAEYSFVPSADEGMLVTT